MTNKPNKVILHCSASKDTSDGSVHFSAEDLENYHHGKLGWKKPFGYHYYITRDGVIHKGRKESEIGAHEETQNTQSVGVCYEGTSLPTIAQVHSFLVLYKKFYNEYGFTQKNWYGHYEFDDMKDCPGFLMNDINQLFENVE